MSVKSHVARKQHRCDTCGRLIDVGERYWREFSDDEPFMDFREHTNCEAYRSAQSLPEGFNQNRSMAPC